MLLYTLPPESKSKRERKREVDVTQCCEDIHEYDGDYDDNHFAVWMFDFKEILAKK